MGKFRSVTADEKVVHTAAESAVERVVEPRGLSARSRWLWETAGFPGGIPRISLWNIPGVSGVRAQETASLRGGTEVCEELPETYPLCLNKKEEKTEPS